MREGEPFKTKCVQEVSMRYRESLRHRKCVSQKGKCEC